jgi:Mg2+-importing ATPase
MALGLSSVRPLCRGLTNFLTDFPAMAIAGDSVAPELVERPRRWDVRFIRDFTVTFGLVSSVFDYLTFGTLLLVVHATQDQFRACWFLESVLTGLLILLVIRAQRPFFGSRPGWYLVASALVVAGVTLALPFSPLKGLLGFTPLPLSLLLVLLGIRVRVLYVITSEVAKRSFYRRVQL